ncbi:MAG: hypothetical protein RMJ88_11005 [Thermogemmata sp.]|nr:hypothetical protein [Thermogemmata sp.]
MPIRAFPCPIAQRSILRRLCVGLCVGPLSGRKYEMLNCHLPITRIDYPLRVPQPNRTHMQGKPVRQAASSRPHFRDSSQELLPRQ